MFSKPRRIDKTMPDDRAWAVLASNSWGILSVVNKDGWPYGVPLNYCLQGHTLYFHCAAVGTKLEALSANAQVCFTVVDHARLMPESYSTHYCSVIAFGHARLITATDEKETALRTLVGHLAPGIHHGCLQQPDWNSLAMIAVDIVHLSGKETPHTT